MLLLHYIIHSNYVITCFINHYCENNSAKYWILDTEKCIKCIKNKNRLFQVIEDTPRISGICNHLM